MGPAPLWTTGELSGTENPKEGAGPGRLRGACPDEPGGDVHQHDFKGLESHVRGAEHSTRGHPEAGGCPPRRLDQKQIKSPAAL